MSCFNSELNEQERKSKVIDDQLKIDKDIYKRSQVASPWSVRVFSGGAGWPAGGNLEKCFGSKQR